MSKHVAVVTLLEKAKASSKSRKYMRYGSEEIDLALAWVFDEVTHGQLRHALGNKVGTGSVTNFLCYALRAAVRERRLVKT